MTLFLKTSDKEIMGIRKKIVLDKAIPVLQRNGFEKSPFSGADFGWHPSQGYFYELCRVSEGSLLETVSIAVINRDRWIKVVINVFKLTPDLERLSELSGVDGIKFKLPPASSTEIQLHLDDIKGIPLFSWEFMSNLHKLKRCHTQRGLKNAIRKLESRIEKDMLDIDRFFKKWHEFHRPQKTTWDGNLLNEKKEITTANNA